MENQAQLVITTIDDRESARRLARLALEEKLAACVQILPGVESHYVWKENVEIADEYLLIFKTNMGMRDTLMKRLKEEHSYETPEILTLGIGKMDADYAKWLNTFLSGDISI